MMTAVRTGSCLVSAGLALALASCEEHPEIEIEIVRENGRAVRLGASMRERFPFSESENANPEWKIADMLQWKLPAGWQQLPPRPLRIVNLRVGEAECYVTYLSGGTAAGNVNRWHRWFCEA